MTRNSALLFAAAAVAVAGPAVAKVPTDARVTPLRPHAVVSIDKRIPTMAGDVTLPLSLRGCAGYLENTFNGLPNGTSVDMAQYLSYPNVGRWVWLAYFNGEANTVAPGNTNITVESSTDAGFSTIVGKQLMTPNAKGLIKVPLDNGPLGLAASGYAKQTFYLRVRSGGRVSDAFAVTLPPKPIG